jgi:hypothetical protein
MTGRKDETVRTKDDHNPSREMVKDDRDEHDDRPFNISMAKVTIRTVMAAITLVVTRGKEKYASLGELIMSGEEGAAEELSTASATSQKGSSNVDVQRFNSAIGMDC